MKVVRSDDREKIIAHQKEFEILNKLKHKNVVRSIEMFTDEFKNKVYQVMEYIEGQEILDDLADSGAYNE